VALNICGSTERNSVDVPYKAPRILRRLLGLGWNLYTPNFGEFKAVAEEPLNELDTLETFILITHNIRKQGK
jgi:hypothetical protein